MRKKFPNQNNTEVYTKTKVNYAEVVKSAENKLQVKLVDDWNESVNKIWVNIQNNNLIHESVQMKITKSVVILEELESKKKI